MLQLVGLGWRKARWAPLLSDKWYRPCRPCYELLHLSVGAEQASPGLNCPPHCQPGRGGTQVLSGSMGNLTECLPCWPVGDMGPVLLSFPGLMDAPPTRPTLPPASPNIHFLECTQASAGLNLSWLVSTVAALHSSLTGCLGSLSTSLCSQLPEPFSLPEDL